MTLIIILNMTVIKAITAMLKINVLSLTLINNSNL